MESTAIIAAVVAAIGALVIGIFLGKMIFAKNTKKEVEEAEIQAKKTLEDAKTLAETIKEKKEEGWEEKWAAWIFQVIAALCAMQHLFSMTHNDLHTNNIVWSHCDEEFLYYRANGHTWQVPTYGKVFKIIDFGRSIYKLKDKVVYSDDFLEGNDAGNQYNFGDFKDESKK